MGARPAFCFRRGAATGERVLGWLPSGAAIDAYVFPEITRHQPSDQGPVREHRGSRMSSHRVAESGEAAGKDPGPFWGGAQGAWYTVGYEMAALVETNDGRQALLECMIDPRRPLFRYNRIALDAQARGATLAAWSPAFLDRLSPADGGL
jgi:hypothetical protein